MKRKIGIWVSCIILLGVIGLWALTSDNNKTTEDERHHIDSPTPPSSVTVPAIRPQPSPEVPPSPVTIPEVISGLQSPDGKNKADQTQDAITSISESPVLQPERDDKQVEVPLTNSPPAPKPTEPPKPKPKETHKPQSADKPPTYDEKETQPNKQQDMPNAGDKNENGKVFFPGFGWIEQGGPNQSSQSESDGDWNKQVGTMD